LHADLNAAFNILRRARKLCCLSRKVWAVG
jgi:transposase